MEVSKLTLSEDLKKQESSITKALKWIQDNPRMCQHTSIPTMAKWMNIGLTNNSKCQLLTKMVRQEILHRTGTIRHSTFTINYFHSKVAPEIRERASADDKERIQRTLALVKGQTNKHINEVGCVVTEENKKQEQKPQPKRVAVKTVEATPMPVKVKRVSSEAPEENTTSVPVTVTNTERGISISITLNINLK